MDQEILTLIKLLLKRTLTSVDDIILETDSSQRKIFYRLDKLNMVLDKNRITKIKINERIFIIQDDTRDFLLNYLHSPFVNEDYYMNRLERIRYIYLMMFIDLDYLSLQDIIYRLDVSKSTIMQDFKELAITLENSGINIDYSREKGYFIQGNEYKIRQKMLEIVVDTIAKEGGNKVFDIFLDSFELNSYFETKKSIEKISRDFDLHFVDNRLSEFVYIFLFSTERIRKDNHLNLDQLTNTSLIRTFKEYRFTETLLRFFGYNYFSLADAIYISSWVLGSIVGDVEETTEDIVIIGELSGKILSKFEHISGTDFENKEKIYRHIYSHMRPAYYRMMFKQPIANPLCKRVKLEYPNLFYLVKVTMNEFKNIFGTNIPDEEIAYLTLHFSTIYHNTHKNNSEKKRALILCSHGIGTSVVLYNELSSLFPQFEFDYPLSEHNFDYNLHGVDIIFTTGYFPKTDKRKPPIIKVNPILDSYEKSKIVEEVFFQLKMSNCKTHKMDLVANILGKHLDKKYITDGLIQDINTLIYKQPNDIYEQIPAIEYDLKKLLKPHYIYCLSNSRSWSEVIQEVSKDLIIDGVISSNYAEVIMNATTHQIYNYLISPNIVLPHTLPEYGVYNCVMSFLILKNPVYIEANLPIKYVFFLAAEDNKKHIPAMRELIELIQDVNLLEQMSKMTDPQEIYELIFQK